MAKLSKNSRRSGSSHGHDFDRVEETLHGHGRYNMNRRKELFSNDYIYTYEEDTEGCEIVGAGGPSNGETGINKNRHQFHDMDFCNDLKNEAHTMNRFIDSLPIEDDDIIDIMEMMDAEEEGEFDE